MSKKFIEVRNNVDFDREGNLIKLQDEQMEIIPIDTVMKVYRYFGDDDSYIICCVFRDPCRKDAIIEFKELVPSFLYGARLKEIKGLLEGNQ